jgi:hypothetical protein
MFWLAEPKTKPRGPSFGPICANESANHRGSVCGGVGIVVKAMARCIGLIGQGAHFGWQNRKPSGTGSVLVRYAQTRGSACGGAGVVVEAVACCVGPIERRARFGWQNCKPSCTSSVLVWAGRLQLAYVQETRTVIEFEPWAYAIMHRSATVCEIKNKMLNHSKFSNGISRRTCCLTPYPFQIEVVAATTLDVHAQFTPPTLSFKEFCYLEYIHIYYSLLTLKFCIYYIAFYKQKVANTVSLGCSSRFAGSNKISRAHHITQALPDS